MIIIVDGPDRAGKSLLCSLLSKATGYKIEHLSKDYVVPVVKSYLDLLDHDNTIFDRFYYSEIIYSNIKHRNLYLSDVDCMQIDEKIEQVNAIVLHVTSDFEVLQARLVETGDDYINSYELDQLKMLYDDYMARKDNVTTLNTNINSGAINELVRIIGRSTS